ncbi:hypothetical protein [uncultured Tateyamaria sp.]|uniref:hypothetical protein n=1 Tax=uncultured Tateyamaria sp. TaxID=455651 RepID=UPI0026347F7E|nr:hypothetical protein [uncultured Tateyamaria sp.]
MAQVRCFPGGLWIEDIASLPCRAKLSHIASPSCQKHADLSSAHFWGDRADWQWIGALRA